MNKAQQQLSALKIKRAGGINDKSADTADKNPDNSGNIFGVQSHKKKTKSQQA